MPSPWDNQKNPSPKKPTKRKPAKQPKAAEQPVRNAAGKPQASPQQASARPQPAARPRPKVDDKAKAKARGQVGKAQSEKPSSKAVSASSAPTARRGADANASKRPIRRQEATPRPVKATAHNMRRERSSGDAEKPARHERHTGRKVLLVALTVVVIIAGLFAWQRWFRYDDAADIQGVWKVNAANETMVIDAKNMNLTHGVLYAYALDTTAKTISFSFSNLSGAAGYYFSQDRKTFVLNEGGAPANILVQLGFLQDPNVQSDTMSDNTTVLTKISDDTTATPQSLTNNSSTSADSLGAAIVAGQATQSTEADASSSSTATSSSDEDLSFETGENDGTSTTSYAADTPADGSSDE